MRGCIAFEFFKPSRLRDRVESARKALEIACWFKGLLISAASALSVVNHWGLSSQHCPGVTDDASSLLQCEVILPVTS